MNQPPPAVPNFTPSTITVEQVNRELKRKKSSEELTTLSIKEVELPAEELRDMQNVIHTKDTFRKFYISFRTASGRSDSGDSLFLRSQRAFTPVMVAENIIRELTYSQLPKSEQEAIDKEQLRQETNLVLVHVLTTFVATIAMGWLSTHFDSPSVFYQYAMQVRSLVSGAALLATTYFYLNPSPGRRVYYYSIVGFALAWLAAMGVTVL